jgi:hypothetical protein
VTRAHFDGIVARMLADRQYWDLVELGARVAEGAERLILQRRSGPSTLCTSPLRCFQMGIRKAAALRYRRRATTSGRETCRSESGVGCPRLSPTVQNRWCAGIRAEPAGTEAAKRAEDFGAVDGIDQASIDKER